MTGARTVLDPHVAIFAMPDGGYSVSHNYPSIPGVPDLNAFDVEDAVMRTAAGLLRLRGHGVEADQVMAVARQVRRDSRELDKLTAPGGVG